MPRAGRLAELLRAGLAWVRARAGAFDWVEWDRRLERDGTLDRSPEGAGPDGRRSR